MKKTMNTNVLFIFGLPLLTFWAATTGLNSSLSSSNSFFLSAFLLFFSASAWASYKKPQVKYINSSGRFIFLYKF